MDARQPGPLTNDTLELLRRRRSTRTYRNEPLTADERQAIVHAALRAPTAGNMVLYTIIEITDQKLKERLAQTCDDQPFIAQAPWVLLFVADYQKWTDLWDGTGAWEIPAEVPRRECGPGDALLACCDALIAAHSAVVAASSLGIGSCYIGDVMENGEIHAELLDLPPHTLPVAMVCFGRPAGEQTPIEHYGRHLVHENRYRRLTQGEIDEVADDLGALHAPHGMPVGVASYPQQVYRRKFASAFSAELNRSVAWWLGRWERKEGAKEMDAKQQVLDAMKAAGKPVNAGTLVQMTGLERAEVDKVMATLKKSGEIESPVRCMWQPKA